MKNSFERQIRSEGTPLTIFYDQRKRLQTEKDISDSIPELDISSENILENTSEETTRPSKRKTDPKESDKNEKIVTKRKRQRKRRVRNNKKTKSDSFDLNQNLSISSDESD